MKQLESWFKDKTTAVSEDDGKQGKEEVESLTKKNIANIAEMPTSKSKEVETI